VRQPSFVAAAAALWADRPLEQWKAWLAIRTALACADSLNDAVVQEDFAFYGRTLSGTPELRERWKRGVSLVEGALGEAGRQALRRAALPRGARNGWSLSSRTSSRRTGRASRRWTGWARRPGSARWRSSQVHAQDRLPGLVEGLLGADVQADDLLGNVLRASEWETDQELAKIGKPIDRTSG
jgi:putative endopeptidase